MVWGFRLRTSRRWVKWKYDEKKYRGHYKKKQGMNISLKIYEGKGTLSEEDERKKKKIKEHKMNNFKV